MKKLIVTLTITLFVSLISVVPSYPITPDEYERLNGNGSKVMSPGWMNIDKQRSESMKESIKPKASQEEQIENINADLKTGLTERTVDKINPDLKGPRGGGDTSGPEEVLTAYGNKLLPSWDPEAMKNAFLDAKDRGANITTLSNGTIVKVWYGYDENGGHSYLSVTDGNGVSILQDAEGNMLSYAEVELEGDWEYEYASSVTDIGNGKFSLIAYAGNWDSWTDTITSPTGYSIDTWNYTSESVQAIRIYDTTSSNALGDFNEHRYTSSYSYIFDRENMTATYFNDSTYIGNFTPLGGGEYAMSVYRYEGSGTYQYKFSGDGTYLEWVSGSWGDYDNRAFIAITDESLDYDYTGDDSNKYFLENEWTDNSYTCQWVSAITGLGNGEFVAGISEYSGWQDESGDWHWSDGTRLDVMDSNFVKDEGRSRFIENSYTWGYDESGDYYYNGSYKWLTNLVSLGNGDYAAAWVEDNYSYSANDWKSDNKIVLEKYYKNGDTDAVNLGKAWDWSYTETSYWGMGNYITDLEVLDDGTLFIALNTYEYSYDWSTGDYEYKNDSSLARIDEGEDAAQFIDLGLGDATSRTISNLTKVGGNEIAFVLDENSVGEDGQSLNKTTVETVSTFGETAKAEDSISLDKSAETAETNKIESTQSAIDTDTSDTGKTVFVNTSETSNLATTLDTEKLDTGTLSTSLDDFTVDAKVAESLLSALDGSFNSTDALGMYSLLAGSIDGNTAMSILASIMKNPTEEQKVMLSAVTALLSDLEKAAKEAENSEEVKKAREEFAEIAAVAMIAQALPDLFKEGDMANVKGLFGELSGVVSDIVGKYEASLDPYYNKVKDDISDNITLLQLQDIISKDITKDKLAKLPHGEIDRILGKIKRLKDKNFTEECILKNEVKYRAEYVEPQKKLMEENIKQTIGDFSKKIQSILSTAAIK